MPRLRGALLALVLTVSSLRCAADPAAVPSEPAAAGALCAQACDRRLEAGCVADVAACIATCTIAREAAACTHELEANLTCLVEADHLHCGRPPNGSECDGTGVALEHCLTEHAIGTSPPDCYGKACSWVCDPIGKQLCTPDQIYDCNCPSGAPGETRCSADGCFLLPCACPT